MTNTLKIVRERIGPIDLASPEEFRAGDALFADNPFPGHNIVIDDNRHGIVTLIEKCVGDDDITYSAAFVGNMRITDQGMLTFRDGTGVINVHYTPKSDTKEYQDLHTQLNKGIDLRKQFGA